jgi:hypothetical protein
MQIEKKDKYTLISSDENTLEAFQNSLLEKINDFEKAHLILQVSEKINVKDKDFSLILDIVENKQEKNTSVVIINADLNLDNFPEHINIVPTMQEAEDILEMEAIERELGF